MNTASMTRCSLSMKWRNGFAARKWLAGAGALGLLLAVGSVARAELKVSLSRTTTGAYQSVGITVAEAVPTSALGEMSVTIADGADRRQTVSLHPQAPGLWHGRYTPVTPGAYTGTAVLTRDGRREIGLVPRFVVKASRSPGFVRLGPSTGRCLIFSRGGTLFPIGVQFTPEAVASVKNWGQEFRRLKRAKVNFAVLPVAAPGEAASQDDLERTDAAVLAAELVGVYLQVELPSPSSFDESGLARLKQMVSRWSYSPAVAVWCAPSAPLPEQSNQLIEAVRSRDPYRRPIAGAARERVKWDLAWGGMDLRFPAAPGALLYAGQPVDSPLLPGENSWQGLAAGGVGMPMQPYDPRSPVAGQTLRMLEAVAGAAAGVAWKSAVASVPGVIPADVPGSVSMQGGVVLVWMPRPEAGVVTIPRLAKGSYRFRCWDAATNRPVAYRKVISTGGPVRIALPPNVGFVYFQLEPTGRTRVRAVVPRN